MGDLNIDVENSKRFILKEIRRTAEKNGGVPLGMITFYKATGIKIADWRASSGFAGVMR